MAQEPIWPGSGSAVSGNTPFGTYDDDATYQTEAPKFADWCSKSWYVEQQIQCIQEPIYD